MYLVRTLTGRARNIHLARCVQSADAPTGQQLLRDALPEEIAALAGSNELEAMRQRLLAVPADTVKTLRPDDYIAACAIFFIGIAHQRAPGFAFSVDCRHSNCHAHVSHRFIVHAVWLRHGFCALCRPCASGTRGHCHDGAGVSAHAGHYRALRLMPHRHSLAIIGDIAAAFCLFFCPIKKPAMRFCAAGFFHFFCSFLSVICNGNWMGWPARYPPSRALLAVMPVSAG